MTGSEFLSRLPDTNKPVVVVLSGGLDSSICLAAAHQKYGKSNVIALTANYGQRQALEIDAAKDVVELLGVGEHIILNMKFLGQIIGDYSANTSTDVEMPTIKDVLGHPQPKTYVPCRNGIFFMLAASTAEARGCETILCGIQTHDEYGYYDATQKYVDSVNSVLAHNRMNKIVISSPFSDMSKADELAGYYSLGLSDSLIGKTLTCYNPSKIEGVRTQCGKCPSCAERIQAFINLGRIDPVPYAVQINWELSSK